MDFFRDPFADFDDFFADPFGSDESMDEPEPVQKRKDHGSDKPNAIIPSWTSFFGHTMPLSRLSRNIGRSFSDAYKNIEEMSKSPDEDKHTRCFCSATSEVMLPNGAHEVKHTSRDSRTGKELSLHTREIGGKRVTERREKDLRTGREERRQDLLNVEEKAIKGFDKDWAKLFPSRDEGMRKLK